MSIDIQKAKAEAHENASKHVATMLQNPDSLDKVEQWRRRVMRNKASVEARLKSAVQSQLEGVRTGLGQLQSALEDIKQIKQSMADVDDMLKGVSDLSDKLEVVKATQYKHTQLSKACEHLNHIFNVPENVEKTYTLIADGKLLMAHKSLADLEATRDELLYEVHKMSTAEGGTKTDKTPLYNYFSEVTKLSDSLGKQLWIVMQRFLSTVRSDPAQLVTALRIIEREERADKRAKEKLSSTGFSVPGRPKCWKKRCLDVLEGAIAHRLESLEMHLEDRHSEKMWLVKHLERTRKQVLEDLIIVKSLCQPCFPPNYNIFDICVKMYHMALSAMLEKTVIEQRLDSNECVSLLTWISEYGNFEKSTLRALTGIKDLDSVSAVSVIKILVWIESLQALGIDLMMHPELQVDVSSLDSLLSDSVYKNLKETYITTTSTNIKEWMGKMIETDRKDWHNSSLPEADGEGFYNTSLPVFLFQMVDQNLQVASQTGEELKLKIFDICIEEMQDFQRGYKKAIRDFKSKHFEDRSLPPRFIEYMIAIVNNCMSSIKFTEQLRDRTLAEVGKGTFGEDRLQIFKSIIDFYDSIGQEGCRFLLEEVFLDLEPFFAQIMTPNWVSSPTQVDTIIATIEDYSSDFAHLKPNFLQYTMHHALEKVLLEYVRAMMNKKLAFKSYEERKDAAKKIAEEATKFENLFKKRIEDTEEVENQCSVLPALAEVIKLQDTSMMALEISGLAAKYPDLKSDHAMALLLMRGDVWRNEAKEIIMETSLADSQKENQEGNAEGFFGQIIVPPSLLDKLESAMKSKLK